MIIGIHHAQITVPKDMENQAHEFYCGVLGLKEVPKPPNLRQRGGFWLQVDDIQVHVGTEDHVDRNSTKAHLAYEVTDLGLWRGKLSAHNIEVLQGEPLPGYNRFEFRDPFGNRVEMIQRL